MDILTIEQYGEAERTGAERSCNRIIQCRAPTLFLHLSYPTTVASMTGLRRYVDVMHEGRVAATFRDYLDLRIVGGRLRRCGVANAYILPGLEDGHRRLEARAVSEAH